MSAPLYTWHGLDLIPPLILQAPGSQAKNALAALAVLFALPAFAPVALVAPSAFVPFPAPLVAPVAFVLLAAFALLVLVADATAATAPVEVPRISATASTPCSASVPVVAS